MTITDRKMTIGKVVKSTLLITSILLIAISTITGSFKANARRQEQVNQELFNNPQSVLNIAFKDNVYLDNIIDNELNPDKNWQGLRFDSKTFGISSVSGLSNFGGQDEMVSISGQFNTDTLKNAYANKYKEMIVKLDDLKNNGAKLKNYQLRTKKN